MKGVRRGGRYVEFVVVASEPVKQKMSVYLCGQLLLCASLKVYNALGV